VRRILLGSLLLAACHHASLRSDVAAPVATKAPAPRAAFIVADPPVSLTASDGTGLRINALHARAVIEGPLAFTELTLAFQNPTDRTLEGRFRLALPSNASLSRFAMKIGDQWQDGEIVELARARGAYEDFLHRKQDPALMERAGGNEFSARVFPIPANGIKEIVVAYVEEVKGGKYTLPLRGLPTLGELAIETNIAPALHATDAIPADDFTADVKAMSVRSGDLAVIRVTPPVDSTPEEIDDAIVLVDTSASRALGFAVEIDTVEKLLAKVRGHAIVAAFDQLVAPVYDGPARAFDRRPLEARGALGASDLERALGWASKTAARGHIPRVIVVTDGVVTAGATAKLDELKSAGVQRVDAVAVGGIRDDATLGRLVRGTFAHDGVIAEATELDKLTRVTRSHIAVKIEGAAWSWPATLDGMQAGDSASIYAKGAGPMRVSFDGAPARAIELETVDRPLVERAYAQAQMSSVIEQEAAMPVGPEKDGFRGVIVATAVRERIMTPFTAMLVLETEADYRRFGLTRTAPSDILAIEHGALTRVHRKPPTDLPDYYSKAGWVDAPATATRHALGSEPPPGTDVPAPMDLGAIAAAAGQKNQDTVAFLHMDAADDERVDLKKRPEPRTPYEGRFKNVMDLLAADRTDDALAAARGWRSEAPGDVLALVALGEAAEAKRDLELAERAYGSIIDLFSNRADLRRFAGERLERVSLKDPNALDLAIDTYEKALADRPDHPSAHRLLTFALLRRKDFAGAFQNAIRARHHIFSVDRFAGTDRILKEDIGLTAAALIADQPAQRVFVMEQLRQAGGIIEHGPSIRFVLNWETDSNDVDFHIHDAVGGHAFYQAPHLKSGGDLYADVTTGYGPECFTIRGPARPVRPYHLEAQYYSRGPMGYGMGKLEVVEHDGAGHLTFDERPFVVMVDHAFVDLGTVK
jgi:tetratricopeptide (TPR) repeat protein